jgi:uncharacterized protein
MAHKARLAKMESMQSINRQKLIFGILPICLLVSTSVVFYCSSLFFGKSLGYLLGFLFYWIIWCWLIPSMITKKSILFLFIGKYPLLKISNWWIILLFLATIISPIFMYFIPGIHETPFLVFLVGIPFAFIHGFFEETFWRGLYIKIFPDDIMFGLLVPIIGFSIWHIAPQFSISAPNALLFVLSTLPLGITYGLIAYKTKSAKWSALGHSISGIFAFSGYLAISFINVIN